MKLTQFNTRIFVQELEDLGALINRVQNQANVWLDGQERREKGGYFNQYDVQAVRYGLESQLNELREKLALVYDFQGDRGMADFVPAGFNIEEEVIDQEIIDFDGVDPMDFSFFPKKKENLMKTFFDNYYRAA